MQKVHLIFLALLFLLLLLLLSKFSDSGTCHLTSPVSLQHQRCLTLLHKPSALDVFSEVLLEGDNTGTNTLELFSANKT